MSALKTYDRSYALGEGPPRPEPWHLVPAFKRDEVLAPGGWVTHPDLGGFGMVIAINDDQLVVLWSEEPRLPDFRNFKLPTIKRMDTASIARELIKVQPMSVPSSLIFYLDYQYGSGSLDDKIADCEV